MAVLEEEAAVEELETAELDDAALDEELETAAKQGLIDKKVYALGGMNLDNVKEAKALGFGGIVICGDLWNRFNIHNEIDYKELLVHGHVHAYRVALDSGIENLF